MSFFRGNRIFDINTSTSTVSGTTTSTILYSYYIAPNLLNNADSIQVLAKIDNLYPVTSNVRLYINTNNNLAGATSIDLLTFTTTTGSTVMRRHLHFSGGTLKTFPFSTPSEFITNGNLVQSTPYVVTQGYYLMLAVGLGNTTGATQCNFVKIDKL